MEKSGMRTKTIKSIINNKINKWLESIENEALRKRISQNIIVTGGCIVSMLMGEDINDFDIYFRDHDTTLAIANYYIDRFKSKKRNGIDVPLFIEDRNGRIKVIAKSAGIVSASGTEKPYEYFESARDENAGGEYIEGVMSNPQEIEDSHEIIEKEALKTKEEKDKPKYRPVFITSNAITLSDKIQIILRFYGEPDKIHENYDFVHCTCYYSSWDKKLVLRPEALEAMMARELKYVGSKYPICSLVRIRKFVQRNWKINAGQILKIAMQISKLDLDNIDVLEDQLTGVDTAYFVQLIEKLKEKDPSKVDTAYLVELVDRIF